MGQIHFASVCVSICVHSHARISWIFTKIGTDVKTPKKYKPVRWGKHLTTLSPFCPPKITFYANCQNSRILQEIGVEKHDGDVRFWTESGNIAVSCMQ